LQSPSSSGSSSTYRIEIIIVDIYWEWKKVL
jgi:hypothetical protein